MDTKLANSIKELANLLFLLTKEAQFNLLGIDLDRKSVV